MFKVSSLLIYNHLHFEDYMNVLHEKVMHLLFSYEFELGHNFVFW